MNVILKYIWSHWKHDLLKYHFTELTKGVKYSMEHAHTDSEGRSYLRFTDAKMPLERIGKMQDYIDLMGSGLSREELSDLIASADNELAKMFSGKKGKVSHVGWVLQQIQDRAHIIMHPELLYHFVAVQLVRDDEPINTFVESIHLEKIAQFKRDNTNYSTYFFFQVPELKMVNERLKFSPTEWDASWKESQKLIEQTKQKIDHLASVKESLNATRTAEAT